MERKQAISIVIAVAVVILLIYYLYPQGTPETNIETGASYMDVSAAEAKDLIDNNLELIVIDVSPHYANGHLPRAISYYPISTLEADISNLDPNAMYLIYCHADGPSRSGAQVLVDAGFENIYRLESHFSGWQAAGYEIEQ